MFRWSTAKSAAESFFSRWVVKRGCKFLLKKKLGKLLLGDIDLDQLDVQLTQGTIQLHDLALNVDYLNSKLGAATSICIKEGSIGSLLVKMPWKGNGCRVEVNELEIVLAPCIENSFSDGDESCSSSPDGNVCMHNDSRKHEHEMADSTETSTSNNVHEGVKTIAKMVKLFLTSFNVKIRNLIVAFDPFLEKDEKKLGCQASLVLRISEIECGTCVSEDANSNTDARAEDFLGISRLTNFAKFQGAILELLQMDNVDTQACGAAGTTFGEQFLGCCPSNATTPIMTGRKGGVSGNLKLSIPWKNGSLDIRKVDADVSIDPLELRFQPSMMKRLLLSWETYKNLSKDRSSLAHYKSLESVSLNSNLHCHSSALISDEVTSTPGRFSSELSSLTVQESVTEAMLPGTRLIQDWMPFSVSRNQKDCVAEDIDIAASVDQFFECFDGMRSSQSALGSSGMWNWTCSVFSAITAASTLASGSLHIPSEQQHVQTNLKATFAGISVLFSFHDEDNKQLHGLHDNQNDIGSDVHYLGAECRDINLVLQVCPQDLRVKGMVKYVEVAGYINNEDHVSCGSNNDANGQTLLIQHLQAEVQGALPSVVWNNEDPDSDELRRFAATNCVLGDKGHSVKTSLLRTSGATYCKYAVESNSSGGSLMGSKSFSLELPPLICWVNFSLINMLLDLFKEVGKSVESFDERNGCSLDAIDQKHGSSRGDVKRGFGSSITTLSGKESLRGNILIPNARVVLCFPCKAINDIGDYCSWEQFIVLDVSSPLNMNKEVLQETSPISDASSQKSYSSMATQSLHLNVGSLGVYLVTSASGDNIGANSSSTQGQKFSAHGILSVCNRPGCFSVISMLWQEGPVTGPWVAERAKALATLEESTSTSKVIGKGNEFATVTTLKDVEDLHSQTQQEIVLSSANFLHVRLNPVVISLDSSEYVIFHGLLTQMVSGLSCMANDEAGGKEEASVMQASILVECESVEILCRPDIKENIKSSMQCELPGSWNGLKLDIKKFEMLSVSNIGGIKDADFFWLSHGEGKLWGSVTAVPNEEFLLISCSNSTMKRGDGGGSNALSSRLAGSDIIHLWQPQSMRSYLSITVRCSTIVAIGGRLDWLDTITSFFNLPPPEIKEEGDSCLEKGESNASYESSFVLNLVDIGLSYDPYLGNSVVQSAVLGCESCSSNVTGAMCKPFVTCMLAASSLNLSNRALPDSMDNDYNIRVQDLGLLLSLVSESRKLGGTYSVEYLREMGYVKVAREALIEIVFRTNCRSGLLWEVECSKSQVSVETCHDTTAALIRLAGQLQRLFAPDVEESLVHLQTRWNNFQQAQEKNELTDKTGNVNSDSTPSTPQGHSSSIATYAESGGTGLMNEICDNAFSLDGSQTCQVTSSESPVHISLDESFLGEACCASIETPEILSPDVSPVGLDKSQTSFLPEGCIPEIIDGYCLSELQPPSELGQSSHEIRRCRSWNAGDGDLGRGKGGWYGDAPLRIVENHISEAIQPVSMKQFMEGKPSPPNISSSDDGKEVMGRVLLKNVNVSWRMFAGSVWYQTRTNFEHSGNKHGRDTTVCLELLLSGMQFQYDVFTTGGIGVSKLSLSIQDFHLYDRSSAAPWKLVLGYYNSKAHPRESTSKAFKLDLESVRPDPLTPLEEYRLRIAFLPILLHLHQSQLDFLIDFFGSNSTSDNESSESDQDLGGSKLSGTECNNLSNHGLAAEALLPYFQKFEIWPILVRVDYSPLHVDLAALRGGKYVELVNLVPWKGVELQLKHVHAVGVYGWGNVCETIIGEWLEDISQNQIHKVLQGLPTIRSLVAVGAGAAKLVSLPVESYRKDHRVLRGMQRGTIAFLRSISLEAVGLGVHLAAGAHDILLQAEYILTSSLYSLARPVQGKTKTNVRSNQPKDAKQGIQQAYESLSDGLGKSASVLVRTPLKKFQRGASAGTALATAVRAVPVATIAPASGCLRAVHYTLLGIRNGLDPEHKKESMEKYLGPAHPQD